MESAGEPTLRSLSVAAHVLFLLAFWKLWSDMGWLWPLGLVFELLNLFRSAEGEVFPRMLDAP